MFSSLVSPPIAKPIIPPKCLIRCLDMNGMTRIRVCPNCKLMRSAKRTLKTHYLVLAQNLRLRSAPKSFTTNGHEVLIKSSSSSLLHPIARLSRRYSIFLRNLVKNAWERNSQIHVRVAKRQGNICRILSNCQQHAMLHVSLRKSI